MVFVEALFRAGVLPFPSLPAQACPTKRCPAEAGLYKDLPAAIKVRKILRMGRFFIFF